MRLVAVAGLASVQLAHVIITRLLAMVETVRVGDPFITANATRLRHIAWVVLGLEVLHLAVGIIAANSASVAQPLDLNWSFSITPWAAVLLLFVLARVFEVGARGALLHSRCHLPCPRLSAG